MRKLSVLVLLGLISIQAWATATCEHFVDQASAQAFFQLRSGFSGLVPNEKGEVCECNKGGSAWGTPKCAKHSTIEYDIDRDVAGGKVVDLGVKRPQLPAARQAKAKPKAPVEQVKGALGSLESGVGKLFKGIAPAVAGKGSGGAAQEPAIKPARAAAPAIVDVNPELDAHQKVAEFRRRQAMREAEERAAKNKGR